MVGDLRLPGASSARSFPLPWPQLHGESLTGILLWSFEGEPLPALRRKCIELPGNSFHNVLRKDGRTPQEVIHAIPNFSYRVQNYTGKGFLCIGDSHRFIDPIFAYGVYFGIQDGEFATEAIARYLSGEVKSNANPFADFERLCDQGQDVVEDVIAVLWEYPLAFQRIMTWRDKVDSLDLLAGRIYGEEGAKNPARVAMRRLPAIKEREREKASAAKAVATAESPELAPAG